MDRHASRRSALFAGMLVCALAAAPAQAASPAAEYGRGAACALGNLIYGPLKLLYASGGALVASVAYAFSAGDADVARPIADAALRGDYVITPDHLQRRKPLEFIGRLPAHSRAEGEVDWEPAPDEGVGEGF